MASGFDKFTVRNERDAAIVDRAVAAAASRLPVLRALQSGTPPAAAVNGSYDEDGNFAGYLRLDIDSFDSGRTLAP